MRKVLCLTGVLTLIIGSWSLVVSGQQSTRTARPAAPPTPRLANGTPNLGRAPGEKTGVWDVPYIQNMADRVTGISPRDSGRAAGRGPRAGSSTEPHIPFMPWSAAVFDYQTANVAKFDPEAYCLPPGGPRMMATPYPLEIIQLPERMFFVFEGATHIWREVYMDGRPHPPAQDLNPTYLGHSVGKWDKDTLVIDVVGFNEATWLDHFGHPHTRFLHVIERITRPDKNTLHYEATIDDPGAYTRPWTTAWDIPWDPNDELVEYVCQENNRYLWRLTDDLGQPLFGMRQE